MSIYKLTEIICMQNRQVKPLLESILEDLPAQAISVIDTEDSYVLCGFKSHCSMIIDDLAQLVKPIQVYRTGEQNYIAVYSRQAVASFLEEKFRKLKERILPLDCYGHFDTEHGYVFSDEKAYQNFIRKQNVVNAARSVGIDYGTYEIPTINRQLFSAFSLGSGFSFFQGEHYEPPQTGYCLNFYSDSNAIYHAIFPDCKKRKAARQERQTFLQGANSSHSAVNSLTNRSYAHEDVIKNIFSFLALPESKTELKSIPVVACVSEKDQVNENLFIKKIKILILQLEKEVKSSIDEIKNDKIKFLKLILNFKKANPTFALSECLKLTISFYPDLYKKALDGIFSRTKRLLAEIKDEKKNIKKTHVRASL